MIPPKCGPGWRHTITTTINEQGTIKDYYDAVVKCIRDNGFGGMFYEGRRPLPLGPVAAFYEKEVSVEKAAYALASRGC